MTKFLFLLSPNLVISYYIYQIRHLIIISALLTKKKGQEEIDCVSSKYTPIQRFEKRPKNPYPTREMPDQSSLFKKRPNISLQNEQKYCQEMVFSLKKTKESFLPPLKTTKISLIKSNEKKQNFALFCSCEFVLEINTPEEKSKKKSEGGT